MAVSGQLAGRLAIVTGGASGIGHAVCRLFAREGARVAVVDQDGGLARKAQEDLGEGHHSFTADVSNVGEVTQLLGDVRQAFSDVPSIAVNCAGITQDQFLLKMEPEQFEKVINVNLKGTFLVTQAVARLMAEQNVTEGAIVNVSSIVAKVGNLGQCNYAASKAGVLGFTKTAAKELARQGIRCNAILPGFIKTPMTDAVPEKVIELMKSQIPMARLGTPEDVADLCLFLSSRQSSYITGTCIEVAGGLHM